MTIPRHPDIWPTPPEGVKGTQIRHRKVIPSTSADRPNGVRLGGAEPKVIIAETDKWVVTQTYSASGRFLCETAFPKPEFDREFERRREPLSPYISVQRLWGHEVVRRGNNLDTVIATYKEKRVAELIVKVLESFSIQEVREQ